MTCTLCNINNGKLNNIFNKILCKQCLEFDEYKLICKSEAITTFILKDNDIDTLNYIEVQNPRFKCSPNMKLYSYFQIKKIFFEKYDEIITNNNIDCDNNIDDIIDIIKEIIKNDKNNKKNILLDKLLLKMNIARNDVPVNLIKDYLDGKKGAKSSIENIKYKCILLEKMNDIDPKIKKEINNYEMDEICKNIISGKYTEQEIIILLSNKQKKREILKNELNKYNLKIRNDSVLCDNFIEGDDTYTLNELVNIMVEMDWYYKYTNYSKIIKKLYDDFFHKQKSYGYYDELDEYDKMEISKNAKKLSLEQWIRDGMVGDPFPEKI
jgi:hypothetical protein